MKRVNSGSLHMQDLRITLIFNIFSHYAKYNMHKPKEIQHQLNNQTISLRIKLIRQK